MKTLLLTSFFPPVHGGSAVVYENLYKFCDNKLLVLTATKDCETNKDIIGQHSYRKQLKNIFTVNLLRAPYIQSKHKLHSLYLLFRYDLPIMLRLYLALYSIIKREKVKVLVIGELHSLSGYGQIMKRIFIELKVINYIHGEELTTVSTSNLLASKSKARLQAADGIVCVSSFTKNELIENWQVDENKIELISNGVNMEDFSIASNIDFHPPRDIQKPYIFSVGRHIERKGFDVLIEAMPAFLLKQPKVKLYIGGQGGYTPYLKELTIKLNLGDYVIFLGRLTSEELTYYYRNCHCFAMPNRTLENGDTEGFGLVFLEANAYNKPVVGGRAGGAVDAINHEETGLLVDSKSINAVSDALVSMFNDEQKYKEMCEKSYAWAKQNDVRYKSHQFNQFCNNLIGKSS
jgi:phosphatidylinositol alpha-1,6-mannosyltransferase